MEPMYVICFYWEGDRWISDVSEAKTNDSKFIGVLNKMGGVSLSLASRYINNLYHGVKRFATRPFNFICFTNESLEVHSDIELRPFPMITNKGVLPRLYMFSPEAGLGNKQVLCLDIDVVIVGSLEKIMAYNGLFCTRPKFNPRENHKIDGDIMSFRAGNEAATLFYDPFIANVASAIKLTRGRERYWLRHVASTFADRWDKVAPDAVQSYKWHVRRKKVLPPRASIISFHGIPRPHQVNDRWLKDYWV